MWGNLRPYTMLVGMQNAVAIVKDRMEVPQKIKSIIIPILIATLFTIAKMWKYSKCSLTDEWIKKCGMYIWYSIQPENKMKFYSMWMNLEDIMLSDIRQLQKDKYCI
jgi:uncharacterized membrane protein YkvI